MNKIGEDYDFQEIKEILKVGCLLPEKDLMMFRK